jgi:DNA-binding MarR family transcriptional regulator
MLDPILAELAKTQRLLRTMLDEASGGGSVGPSHMAVLEALSAHARMTGAELARAASITPQAMNEVVRRLESAGEIARGPHAADKRKIEFEITDIGRARVEKAHAAQAAVEGRLDSLWGESRRQSLLLELGAVNKDLEAELAPRDGEAP